MNIFISYIDEKGRPVEIKVEVDDDKAYVKNVLENLKGLVSHIDELGQKSP